MLDAERILYEKGISYRLIELIHRAITVADVTQYKKGDINVDEICKTVIMRDDLGKNYAFLLVGSDRVDLQKTQKLMSKRLSVANPEEVRASTSAEPGLVCPLTLRIPLTIDQHVTTLQHVNLGSGHHLHGIELKTTDLLRAVLHTVADVAQKQRIGTSPT